MKTYNVKVNGKSYSVEVEEVGAGISNVTPTPIEQKKAAPAATPVAASVEGGTKVNSPMPGTINALKVANGATVKKGQAVLVLEAMKMENDIAATADGVITFVASKGSNVQTGELLAVIN